MQINLVELFLYKRNYKIVHNWFELAKIAHKEAILATATLHLLPEVKKAISTARQGLDMAEQALLQEQSLIKDIF